jgi:Fur family ferric uptake transcriptional regulator
VNSVDNVALHRLRREGQRLTAGREALLETLAQAGRPMTIPMILKVQPSLAQSSVYRNLTILEGVGLVTRISLGDDHAHFELSEELTGEHHHHTVCTECGAVTPVTLTDAAEHKLIKSLAAATETAQFRVTAHRLDVLGVCAACDTP